MKKCKIGGCSGVSIAKELCNKHYLRIKNYGSSDLPEKPKKTIQEVLLSGALKTPDGCLVWRKSLRCGYGRFSYGGKSYSAHIASFLVNGGVVGYGLQVNHKCNNRACIEPNHLYAGTQKDNMRDMEISGRAKRLRGESSGRSKLKLFEVHEIRLSSDSGASLARKYNVSESLIRAVRQRKAWAWV